jgi:hypothetical protein
LSRKFVGNHGFYHIFGKLVGKLFGNSLDLWSSYFTLFYHMLAFRFKAKHLQEQHDNLIPSPVHIKHSHSMVSVMWFHPLLNHGFWGRVWNCE